MTMARRTRGLGAVADQEVLGLLVVVEHHRVALAADAGVLVAAERRVRRIEVVAVGPHPAGLDAAAHAVGLRAVAAPHRGAHAVQRVVGDRERVVGVLERRDRHHRAEDLLLEHAHLVVAGQDGRLDVEPVLELALHHRAGAAGQDLGALLLADLADVEVRQDLLELVVRRLGADHRRRIERMARAPRPPRRPPRS
jgi:ParB family chromosome partitioning protein